MLTSSCGNCLLRVRASAVQPEQQALQVLVQLPQPDQLTATEFGLNELNYGGGGIWFRGNDLTIGVDATVELADKTVTFLDDADGDGVSDTSMTISSVGNKADLHKGGPFYFSGNDFIWKGNSISITAPHRISQNYGTLMGYVETADGEVTIEGPSDNARFEVANINGVDSSAGYHSRGFILHITTAKEINLKNITFSNLGAGSGVGSYSAITVVADHAERTVVTEDGEEVTYVNYDTVMNIENATFEHFNYWNNDIALSGAIKFTSPFASTGAAYRTFTTDSTELNITNAMFEDLGFSYEKNAYKNVKASKGGAIYFSGGALTITNAMFERTIANQGGAIYVNAGDLTLNDVKFGADDWAKTVDGVRWIRAVRSTSHGGAIYVAYQAGIESDLTIHNAYFHNIWITGNVTNTGTNGSGSGGAIYYEGNGDITLTGDTHVYSTHNKGYGGFLYVNRAKDITIGNTDGSSVNHFESLHVQDGRGGVLYLENVSGTVSVLGDTTIDTVRYRLLGGVIYFAGSGSEGMNGNLVMDGNISVTDVRVHSDGNWYSSQGGFIYFKGQDLAITGSLTIDGLVSLNTPGDGTIIYFWGNDLTIRADMKFNGIETRNNKSNAAAKDVFGLFYFVGHNFTLDNTGAAATVDNPTFSGMVLNRGIYFSGYNLVMNNLFFDLNMKYTDTAVQNMNSSFMQINSATSYSEIGGATATLTDIGFTGGTCSGSSGLFYVGSRVKVLFDNLTVTDFTCTASRAGVIGAWYGADVEVRNSYFENIDLTGAQGNDSAEYGGVVLFAYRSSLTVTNSVFKHTKGTKTSYGSAIHGYYSNVVVNGDATADGAGTQFIHCTMYDDGHNTFGAAISTSFGNITINGVNYTDEDGNILQYGVLFDHNATAGKSGKNSYGGAVSAQHSSKITITGALFSNNIVGGEWIYDAATDTYTGTKTVASYGVGGAIYSPDQTGNSLYIYDSMFVANMSMGTDTANGGGGAIYGYSSVIYRTVFKDNKSHTNGGAYIQCGNGGLTVYDSYFINNTATKSGGAFSATGDMWRLEFHSTVFQGNTAAGGVGGAIAVNYTAANKTSMGRPFLVQDSTFIDNVASSSGGAIYLRLINDDQDDGAGQADGFAEVINSVFYNNAAGAVRTTAADGSWTVNSTGTADAGGGALYHKGYQLTIDRSHFEGNSARGEGGAVYYYATGSQWGEQGISRRSMYVYDSNFIDNSAGSNAGAIRFYAANANHWGTFAVDGAAFGGNAANRIWNYAYDADGNLTRTAAAGSNANSLGGAVTIAAAVRSSFYNVTFFENSASKGGAVYYQEAKTDRGADTMLLNVTAYGNVSSGTNTGTFDFQMMSYVMIANSLFMDNTSPYELYYGCVIPGTTSDASSEYTFVRYGTGTAAGSKAKYTYRVSARIIYTSVFDRDIKDVYNGLVKYNADGSRNDAANVINSKATNLYVFGDMVVQNLFDADLSTADVFGADPVLQDNGGDVYTLAVKDSAESIFARRQTESENPEDTYRFSWGINYQGAAGHLIYQKSKDGGQTWTEWSRYLAIRFGSQHFNEAGTQSGTAWNDGYNVWDDDTNLFLNGHVFMAGGYAATLKPADDYDTYVDSDLFRFDRSFTDARGFFRAKAENDSSTKWNVTAGAYQIKASTVMVSASGDVLDQTEVEDAKVIVNGSEYAVDNAFYTDAPQRFYTSLSDALVFVNGASAFAGANIYLANTTFNVGSTQNITNSTNIVGLYEGSTITATTTDPLFHVSASSFGLNNVNINVTTGDVITLGADGVNLTINDSVISTAGGAIVRSGSYALGNLDASYDNVFISNSASGTTLFELNGSSSTDVMFDGATFQLQAGDSILSLNRGEYLQLSDVTISGLDLASGTQALFSVTDVAEIEIDTLTMERMSVAGSVFEIESENRASVITADGLKLNRVDLESALFDVTSNAAGTVLTLKNANFYVVDAADDLIRVSGTEDTAEVVLDEVESDRVTNAAGKYFLNLDTAVETFVMQDSKAENGTNFLNFDGVNLIMVESDVNKMNSENGVIRTSNKSLKVVFDGMYFSNNTAAAGNGAVWGAELEDALISITDTRFMYNTALAGAGAALAITNSTTDAAKRTKINMYEADFRENIAGAGAGGALHFSGNIDAMLDTVFFTNNHATDGLHDQFLFYQELHIYLFLQQKMLGSYNVA